MIGSASRGSDERFWDGLNNKGTEPEFDLLTAFSLNDKLVTTLLLKQRDCTFEKIYKKVAITEFIIQRPSKRGARFSTKAAAAALWSSVSKVRIMWIASVSSTSDKEPRRPTLRLRFM